MDFTALNQSKDYSDEDVFACLAEDKYQPEEVKELLLPYLGRVYPSSLTVPMARILFRTRRNVLCGAPKHPAKDLKIAVASVDVKVEPKAISTIEPTPVVFSNVYGYFLKNPNYLVAMKAAIADVLAYTFTPSTQILNRSCDSNFLADREKQGVPKIVSALAVESTWRKGEAMVNAETTFGQLSSLNYIGMSQRATAEIYAQMNNTLKRVVTRKVAIKGQDFTTLAMFRPPIGQPRNEYSAYKVLQVHRSARGEDAKWLSPMTSGYYIGGIPKVMDKIYWYTADILHIAIANKVSTIVCDSKIPTFVAASLALNNYFVIMLTDTPHHYAEVKIVPGTVVRLHREALTTVIQDALYVIQGMKASMVFTKTRLAPVAGLSAISTVFSIKQQQKCMFMSWMPVCEEVCVEIAKLKMGCEYSVHAHSGSMIVTNAIIPKPKFSLETAIRRIGAANSIKTWFPYSRYRMLEYDRDHYDFQNFAATAGFKMRCRTPPSANKDDYVEIEFDAPDTPFETPPIDVSDKDYENIFKEVPKPSGVLPLPPPLSRQVVQTMHQFFPHNASAPPPDMHASSADNDTLDEDVEVEIDVNQT